MDNAHEIGKPRMDCIRKAYATPKDWEQHRGRIGQLYRTMTLGAVMDTMEKDYGFRATAKMYKDRLAKWKMATKYKKHSIQRKRRRKARTPEPAMPCTQNTLILTPCTTGNDSSPVNLTHLSHPQHDNFENIYRTVNTYIHGSFEAKTWTIRRKGFYSKKSSSNDAQLLETFYRYAHTAVVEKFSQETEALLIIALAPLARLLTVESPFLIVNLLRLAAKSSTSGNNQLLKMVFEHIYGMSKTVHGHLHPITKLCFWISKLSSDVQLESLQRCLECIISAAEIKAGVLHVSMTRIRKYRYAFETHTSNANLTYRDVKMSEILNGKTDHRTLNLQQAYINMLLQTKNRSDWEEAVRLSLQTISFVDSMRAKVPSGWRSICLASMSEAYKLLESPSQAEECMRQSIESGESVYGKYHGRVLLLFSRFERDLIAYGKPIDASKVRQERISRVNEKLQQTLI